ncbi:hypothetical protein ABZT23_20000 [Streptomyces sp. NPDC005386]|uniref:hypothetical protein n=1 Tax=Streptomyces sp. NPDC005386 TaxID=3154562 RepID=UPI0033BDF288
MPIGPLILFDDDHYMYVLRDQTSAEAFWEMPDEFVCGFDSLARPLRMSGEPHQVSIEVGSVEPTVAELRRRVANDYQRFLPEQVPPGASDLSQFVAELPATAT